MKTENRALEKAVCEHASSFSLAGYLRSNSFRRKSADSDTDLFLLMKGGKPSDYYRVCVETCSDIIQRVPQVFVFASFRQQVLLACLAERANLQPIHYLQYLSIKHLIVREVNTLPRFLPDSFCPIVKPIGRILDEIVQAYVNRATILHPSFIRFYYYFDILNETLALFTNYESRALPRAVLVREAMHKLKFTVRCLSLELVSERFSARNIQPHSEARVSRVLSELGYDDLLTLRDDVENAIQTNLAALSSASVLRFFRRTYLIFDSVEEVCDLRKS